jgi:galacturan 1,4-alpha-galacturonidase
MIASISSLAAAVGLLATATQAAPLLDERASCTFTDAASAIKGKTSCTSIVLNGITVPAGTTLDLTGLKAGTTVWTYRNSMTSFSILTAF